MKTPFSVYLCGVLECIGGVLVLLMSLGMVFIFLARPLPPSGPGRGFMLASAGVFALMGTLGLTTGVCVCTRRNWARWSTLIFSWLTMLMCGIIVLASFVMPQPPGVSPAVMSNVKLGMICLSGGFAVLCGWWAWLFSRPQIKALFTVGETEEAGGRPLSISVLGWLLLIVGVIICGGTIVASFPVVIGAWVLTGWTARVAGALYGAAYVSLGGGLLKLREWARQSSIVFLAFGAANGALSILLPGRQARLQAILDHYPWHVSRAYASMTLPRELGNALGLIVGVGVPLYFLLTRKAAFLPVEAVGSREIVLPPPSREF